MLIRHSKRGGGDERLVVIANREPYSHEWEPDGTLAVRRPASGLVTAIEPMLCARGGTWIAHGSGSADRFASDREGRLAVPPGAPAYMLRRVWLDDDQHQRYYAGFANEALWPLFHMAHVKPAFRREDWAAYQAVNETFALAALDEVRDGMILVQDYHFALVPRLIRQFAPSITTSLFWHIPWPNPEIIAICPWKDALLEGMLGANIVGFHTTQYCINFLETARRYLECRVDFDEMSVSYRGQRTRVRTYPISVEWPYPSASRAEGAALRRSLGISPRAHVSIGVDRIDYTKGLVERIAAVEALLDRDQSLIGKYVHVQLASPSRMSVHGYQEVSDELQRAAMRVNERFGRADWCPIVLQVRTFVPEEVRKYYAMADSAVVTPLHDGMNLVAKEYVAACDDGDGSLILSVFAGAAKELSAALLVNPYDVDEVAGAISRAIVMPFSERRARMDAMRRQIATNSIRHWSERLVAEMSAVHHESSGFVPDRPALVAARQELAV